METSSFCSIAHTKNLQKRFDFVFMSLYVRESFDGLSFSVVGGQHVLMPTNRETICSCPLVCFYACLQFQHEKVVMETETKGRKVGGLIYLYIDPHTNLWLT